MNALGLKSALLAGEDVLLRRQGGRAWVDAIRRAPVLDFSEADISDGDAVYNLTETLLRVGALQPAVVPSIYSFLWPGDADLACAAIVVEHHNLYRIDLAIYQRRAWRLHNWAMVLDLITSSRGETINISLFDARTWAELDAVLTNDPEGWRGIARVMLKLFAISVAPKREERLITYPRHQRRAMRAIGVTGFEYRVVRLDHVKAVERIEHGGTHASPRWHIRLGHTRTMSSGALVPVRASEVGDRSRGMIWKDYYADVLPTLNPPVRPGSFA